MELLLELGLTVLLSMLFAYFVSELLSMVSDEVDDVKGKQGKMYQRKKRERKNMRLESEDQEVEFVCEPVKVYQIQSDLVRGNLERVDEVFRRVRFNESDETVIKEALEVIKDTGEDDIFMVENLRLKSEGRFEIFTEPAEWDKIQSDKIQSEIVTFSEFCAKLDEEEVKEDNDDLDANEPMSFMKMVENLRLMENLRSEIDGEFVAEPAATGEEELEEEEEDEELEEEEEDEELEEEEEDEELEEEEEEEELEEEEEEELEEEEEEELEEEEEEELGFEKANGDFAETIRLMKEEALEGVKALEEEEVKGANGDFGETVRLSENDEIVIKKEALEGVKATGEDILMVENMRLKSEGRFEFVAEPAELDEIQSDIVTFSEFCAKLEELCGKLKEEKEVKEANGDFGETVRLSENDEIAVKEEALEGVKALEEKEVKEANGDFGETVRLSENDEIAVKEEALEGVKALEEEEVKETNGDFGEALEEEEVKEANGDFGETVRLKNDEIAVKEEALEGVKATGEDKLIENIEEEVKEEIKMPAEIEDIGVSENQSDRETEVDGATDEDDWEGIEKSEVANLFAPAAAFVESPENRDCLSKVGSDVRMQLYALHKVAIEGPCHVSQPMALKVSARAKWNAWQQLGNMNPETAMEQYISLLSVSVPGWMGENSGDGSNTKSVEAEAPDVSTSILHGHILETKRPEVHQLSVEKADVIVDPNSSNMVKQ